MTARRIAVAAHDDPLVTDYSNVRERDLARRDGLFVAEGEVTVRVLLDGGRFRIRSLFLSDKRISAFGPRLDAAPDDVVVYVAPQEVMDAVVGFPIHRGVLALGERGPAIAPSSLLATDGIVVGLVGITNHDNVGGIFRNAAAFGAAGVVLDPATCDPLYRKSIRVSVGGALVVPFARAESADAMLASFAASGHEVIALSPRGEETLEDLRPAPRRALLLGTEGDGLPEAIMARTRRVRIRMGTKLDSLNVAVASGIALHAVTRSEGPEVV